MNQILANAIDIYKPNGLDWMGYRVSRENPYTGHHIQEKENNGELTIDNIAILTLQAHRLLHKLSRLCPDGYRDFQNLFVEINARKCPLDEEVYSEIYALFLDIFYHNVYHINNIKRLNRVLEISLEKKPKLKQKYINKPAIFR